MAFAGLLVCVGFSTNKFHIGCVTSGCSVYSGYSFAGLTFYHWGALFFAAALVISLFYCGSTPTIILTAGALIADCLFLGYQLLFWPCTNCLLVALIVGALGLSILLSGGNARPLWRKCLVVALGAWLFLFVATSASAIKEVYAQPWVASSFTEQAKTVVYFSPTCPSCKDLVEGLLYTGQSKQIAFIPIAKNSEDLGRLAALPDHILRTDIKRLFSDRAPTASVTFGQRLRLWRNKASLASHGEARVPLVIGDPLDVQKPSLTGKKNSYQSSRASDSCQVVGEHDC
jgi:hypothetical protein